jgi:hypothetical protein
MAFNENLARKRWVMNRIEFLMQSFDDELNFDKQSFDSIGQRHLSTLQDWINVVLVSIGGIVAIATLIAALRQINSITPNFFQELIVVLASVAVALATILLIIIILKYASSVYLKKIDAAYLITIKRVCSVKGLFAVKSICIGSVSISQFYAIFLFAIITYGNRFELSREYSKASESFIYKLISRKHLKEVFKENADIEYAIIDMSHDMYEKWIAFLTDERVLFGQIFTVIKAFYDIDSNLYLPGATQNSVIHFVLVGLVILIASLVLYHYLFVVRGSLF